MFAVKTFDRIRAVAAGCTINVFANPVGSMEFAGLANRNGTGRLHREGIAFFDDLLGALKAGGLLHGLLCIVWGAIAVH